MSKIDQLLHMKSLKSYIKDSIIKTVSSSTTSTYSLFITL